jgi:hypothetical protein
VGIAWVQAQERLGGPCRPRALTLPDEGFDFEDVCIPCKLTARELLTVLSNETHGSTEVACRERVSDRIELPRGRAPHPQ